MTDDQLDTSTSGSIDELRMADLDDVGLPGFSAVVAIAADGEERLVLACRDGINTPAAYWPDWRKTAPHELTGRLPRPYAPTCGRIATSSGRPCRVRVAMYGDSCARHAGIAHHEVLPVYEKE